MYIIGLYMYIVLRGRYQYNENKKEKGNITNNEKVKKFRVSQNCICHIPPMHLPAI